MTLHINLYQNRSSIVEVMIKKIWCVFMAHSVVDVTFNKHENVTLNCIM